MLLSPSGTAQLSLNSFRDTASKGENLHVVNHGNLWKVMACDTAAMQRAGVQFDPEVDTTSIFVDLLGRAFSHGIRDAVVRELALEASPGRPLESRVALHAMAMAEASWQAVTGVDFMTRMMFSAVTRSPGFLDACRALGLSPDAISAPQRTAIDLGMQERFNQAAGIGKVPVAQALAREWLHAELLALNAQKS